MWVCVTVELGNELLEAYLRSYGLRRNFLGLGVQQSELERVDLRLFKLARLGGLYRGYIGVM